MNRLGLGVASGDRIAFSGAIVPVADDGCDPKSRYSASAVIADAGIKARFRFGDDGLDSVDDNAIMAERQLVILRRKIYPNLTKHPIVIDRFWQKARRMPYAPNQKK